MARAKKTKSTKDESSPGFEETIHRLGAIVDQLEGGELPLEESIKLFEEGIGLSRRSQAILDSAEQRVEQLLGIDEDGTPLVKELDDDEL